MISESGFYGGSQFLTIGTAGTHQIRDRGRLIRVDATVSGVVMQLPEKSDFRNAPVEGPAVWIIFGVSGSNSWTLRSPDGSTDIVVAASDKFVVSYTDDDSIVSVGKIGQTPNITATRMKGFSGALAGDPATDETNRYASMDHPAETWTTHAGTALRGYNTSIAHKRSDIYVMGHNNTSANTIEKFSRTGSWSTTSATTTSNMLRTHGGAWGNELYWWDGAAIAGNVMTSPEGAQAVADLPKPPWNREKASCASIPLKDRTIVAFGTRDLLAPWLFHGPTRTYEMGPQATGTYREGASSFVIEGGREAWFVGGHNVGEPGSELELADCYNVTTRTWTVKNAPSPGTSEACGFSVGDTGYQGGGLESGSKSDGVVRVRNNTWSAVAGKMTQRCTKMTDAGATAEAHA